MKKIPAVRLLIRQVICIAINCMQMTYRIATAQLEKIKGQKRREKSIFGHGGKKSCSIFHGNSIASESAFVWVGSFYTGKRMDMEEINRTIQFKERKDEKMKRYEEEYRIEKLVECSQNVELPECVEARIQEAYRKIYEGSADKN